MRTREHAQRKVSKWLEGQADASTTAGFAHRLSDGLLDVTEQTDNRRALASQVVTVFREAGYRVVQPARFQYEISRRPEPSKAPAVPVPAVQRSRARKPKPAALAVPALGSTLRVIMLAEEPDGSRHVVLSNGASLYRARLEESTAS